jgi:DNA-3-methyladenine glycosylase I
MSWYCDYAIGDEVHGYYHDNEYGFPETDDSKLFERLVLEINQAGLNWGLILKKRDNFQAAFQDYDIKRIAKYKDKDRNRLLADAGIIRNRLKVDAVIHNANVVIGLQKSHGSFAEWIESNHPLRKPEWVKLFKKTFKFTGGEITGEFLMSIGYLPGTHRVDCDAFKRISNLGAPWQPIGKEFYK